MAFYGVYGSFFLCKPFILMTLFFLSPSHRGADRFLATKNYNVLLTLHARVSLYWVSAHLFMASPGKSRALITPSGDYSYGSKAWIERQLIVIAKAAMHGRPEKPIGGPTAASGASVEAIPRNHPLALQALMALAKLKGYITEQRRSVSAKLDLTKLTPAELQAVLTGHLADLDPAARRQIESIAAGEYEADLVDEA